MDSIKKYLPTKAFFIKIGAVVLLVLIVVGARMLYLRAIANKQKTAPGQAAPLATPVVLSDLVALENQSGTPDWMTNLKQIIGIPEDVNPVTASNQNEQNETTQFAQDLFSTAATLSEAGPISDDGAQSIASNVTDQIANSNTTDTITAADLKTTDKTDSATIVGYSKSINALMQKYPITPDGINILEGALNDNDPTELAKLQPIIDNYTAYLKSLSALTVPTMFVQSHLELANSIQHLSDTTKSFNQVFDDPVQAMSYLYQFENYITEYQDAITTHGQVLQTYAAQYQQ